MNNARARTSLDASYAESLGTMAYCFASCEWSVAWCCERIAPGSLDKFRTAKLTAGKIGQQFKNLVRNMPQSSARKELAEVADTFLVLVELRNDMLHGKPCTAPGGAQRLSGSQIWEVSDFNLAADRFTECNIAVNGLLHGFLAELSSSLETSARNSSHGNF
jgi:hypothetical protein